MSVHDDAPDLENEFAQLIADTELAEDEAAMSAQEFGAHTLEIRRADGTEVVTLFARFDQWLPCMQPGGRVKNAYIGTREEPRVWVNTWDYQISRDEGGQYVIVIE